MTTTESRIAGLLSVLSESEDAVHCPLSVFARSLREASWPQQLQQHASMNGPVGGGRLMDLSDVLAERSLALLREEEAILRDKEVVRVAYDKLRAELARAEAQLQSYEQRAQEVAQQKSFCKLAMNLLVTGDVPEFYAPDAGHVVGAPREDIDTTNNNVANTSVDGAVAAPEVAPMSSTSPKRPRPSSTTQKRHLEVEPQQQHSAGENGMYRRGCEQSVSKEKDENPDLFVESGKGQQLSTLGRATSRTHGGSGSSPTGSALLAMLRLPDVKEMTLLHAIESYDEYHFGKSMVWTNKKRDELLPVLLGLLRHLPLQRPPTQLAELHLLGHFFRFPYAALAASEPALFSSLTSVSLPEPMVNFILRALLSEGQAVTILTRLLQSVNNDVKCEVLECLLPIIMISCNDVNNTASGSGHASENKGALPDARKEFITCGGLQPLLSIVASCTSEAVLERALVLLWNLIARNVDEEKVRDEVRRLGGLRAVLDLLYTDSIPILENAAMTIGYITRDEASKVEIRESGGLEKITATLRHPYESIQTKMAGAIWNCASNAENRTYLRHIGCIPALLELVSSPYEFVQENAAGALWNLSVDPENKAQIVEYGGIVELAQLIAKSSSVTVVENASGTLWNCSAAVESRPAIRKAAAIPVLLSVMNRKLPPSTQPKGVAMGKKVSVPLPISDKILDNVAGTLRNCAINDQNKPAIREAGGVELLLSKLELGILKNPASIPMPTLDKMASTLWILTISPEIKHSVRLSGGIPMLAKILEMTSVTAAKKNHTKVVVQLTLGVKEKIVGLLRNCSTVQENRQVMVSAGVVRALVYAVEDCYLAGNANPNASSVSSSQQLLPSLQMKETVASALWYLSRDDKVAPREEGGLELLCRLLLEPDQPSAVLEQAAGAISSLTVNNQENRTKLREFGGLDALLRLIEERTPLAFSQQGRSGGDTKDSSAAISTTAKGTNSGTGKTENTVSNTYAVLNALLAIRNSTSSNEENLRYVAEWRYNREGEAAFSPATSFTGWLLYIIQHGSEDCAREAALCVKNLCGHAKSLESLLQQDAVELIGGLAERGFSDSVRRAAAMTLHSLARAQRR
ncbi:vacuolar protein 8 [Trypanosoma rangeli]|uniref:Vacuolar protein 8 n=1 Tax=Trypanosoma rangeli TaxID=5698 RepID=A0A3R7KX09_TRYRA|nr:vacuolar protein 8 [Trypanosoma rangeli]RNF11377.1 vacuolar protein 8 [Trypanosoma rangeli]|eukprot:RNF11377.1 vacuolar protein 8 [Trypanosoma rangeli]